jgi:cell division protein ZapB
MTDDLLTALETKLDQLLQLCECQQKENQQLREKETDWLRERARLIEKNELARTRVEAMITRLKSLEQEG